jgi:hypothetical protein
MRYHKVYFMITQLFLSDEHQYLCVIAFKS